MRSAPPSHPATASSAFTPHTAAARRFYRHYAVAFAIVALLLLAGQALIQRSLNTQAGDGRAINLAGRQRMLSQKLAKTALALRHAAAPEDRPRLAAELGALATDWMRNQRALQAGDAELGIHINNTPATLAAYAAIQPPHEAMAAAALHLARDLAAPDAVAGPEQQDALAVLLRHEPAFLAGMETIVGDYERENQDRLARLRRAELAILAVLLLTLAVEAGCIFRPAVRRLLQAGEDRYRHLFENAVEGIFESTPDGRLLCVNPALARLFGYPDPATMIAEVASIDTDLYVQPQRRAELLSQLRTHGRALGFESEMKNRDGGRFWISQNIRAVSDPADGLGRLQGFVVDITARKRAEHEWLRASKLESLGVLAGGVAHDFNNLLTGILGNLTLARLDAPHAATAAHLHAAEGAAIRARDVTQQLLTFAKGGEPVRATLHLDQLLREAVEFSLHGTRVRSAYDLPADLWAANADSGQLSRVIQNLAINATQAMPAGGTLTIRARNIPAGSGSAPAGLAAGDYVRIGVEDTGCGIAPEHLGKVFDPYFTTKSTGTGLGLATVYSIVKKHEGLIELDSTPGLGTTFHVWLPAVPQARPAALRRPRELAPLKGRVLFMDDDEAVRIMAGQLLTHLGLEAELACHGDDAIRRYSTACALDRPHDLAILDLTIRGGRGGLETLQCLRRLHPGVRAIVSSGYSDNPVMSDYRAHGFAGCIVKPYRIEDLAQVLRATLADRDAARATVASATVPI